MAAKKATPAPKPKAKPKGKPKVSSRSRKPPPRKSANDEDVPRLGHLPKRMKLAEYVSTMYDLDPDLVERGQPQTAAQRMIQSLWRRAMYGDLKSTLLIADWIGEGPKQQPEILVKDADGNPVSGILVTFAESVPPYRLPDTDGQVSYEPKDRGTP